MNEILVPLHLLRMFLDMINSENRFVNEVFNYLRGNVS